GSSVPDPRSPAPPSGRHCRSWPREQSRVDDPSHWSDLDARSNVTTAADWSAMANRLWRLLEPYHALVYFAPEHRDACDRAGLRGGWMAYFASRSAPLGRVPAAVVAALFHNFHPAMVARAIPDAWSNATPADVLAAREQAMDAALDRILGRDLVSERLVQAAQLGTAAATAADPAGRPMFAANLALDLPEAPHLALWQAATMLREHRGDGHVAALTAAEIDGCQAHVLQVAAGVANRDLLQPNRGWSDHDWDEATVSLIDRGWFTPAGQLTHQGRQIRGELAASTDRLAAAPFRRFGEARTLVLLDAMEPITRSVLQAREVPYPNPMGVPVPGPRTRER
ncbi:MAG: hypothetical protein WD734_00785, partial [Dehalococcoidia bacterium]